MAQWDEAQIIKSNKPTYFLINRRCNLISKLSNSFYSKTAYCFARILSMKYLILVLEELPPEPPRPSLLFLLLGKKPSLWPYLLAYEGLFSCVPFLRNYIFFLPKWYCIICMCITNKLAHRNGVLPQKQWHENARPKQYLHYFNL